MRRQERQSCKRVRIWKALLCAFCMTALVCGLALMGASTYFKAQATPSAAPDLSVSDIAASYDEDGFPFVDWSHWQSVNPDIVGWVTVPGTSIDFPIVQAHISNSTFYLSHDIYKNWNYLGCPYLDAECERLGLNSRCAMIYGHNSDDGSMFADFAKYRDQSFAEDHTRILLQTPTEKRILTAAAISIIKGTDGNNRLHFKDDLDFSAWYKDRIKNSFFQLGSLSNGEHGTASSNHEQAEPNSVIAFCTCSYNYWSDERTVIYAIDDVVQKRK